jgi:four helix bundle protein
MQRFEDVRAWQEARKLTKYVFELTASDPIRQEHELRKRLVRATVTGMTEIAAGACCDSEIEFVRHLERAQRSISRLQSLLYTALDLGYIGPDVLRISYEKAARTKTTIDDLRAELERSA